MTRPNAPPPPITVTLRPVVPEDHVAFFAHETDPVACAMAVVNLRDPVEFMASWEELLGDETTTALTILADGELVGRIDCFLLEGAPHVGYWIDRAHWGRSIATRAVAALLALEPRRPLHARVAVTNLASIKVLERNGFVQTGTVWAEATPRWPACFEARLVLR
jgi:RimJ/RimL family protein N-acetyltransferase